MVQYPVPEDYGSRFDCLIWEPIVRVLTAPFIATFTGHNFLLSRYAYQQPEGNYTVPLSADGARLATIRRATGNHRVDERPRGLTAEVRLPTASRLGGDLDFIRYHEDLTASTSTLNFAAD